MVPVGHKVWGCVVVGLWFVGIFVAAVFSYVCTEYLLVHLDARRRVMIGEGFTLLIVLGANVLSFAVMWVSSLVFIAASGTHVYLEATLICAFAQAIWLSQHLWFYYRDHLRVRYDNPSLGSDKRA
jgi:hypothetical protein